MLTTWWFYVARGALVATNIHRVHAFKTVQMARTAERLEAVPCFKFWKMAPQGHQVFVHAHVGELERAGKPVPLPSSAAGAPPRDPDRRAEARRPAGNVRGGDSCWISHVHIDGLSCTGGQRAGLVFRVTARLASPKSDRPEMGGQWYRPDGCVQSHGGLVDAHRRRKRLL